MFDKIKNYDFIITLGFYNQSLLPKCNANFYPFLDCKTDLYVRYEVGTEEGVVALFLYEFVGNSADSKLQSFINALDYGYLSAESNVSTEEFAELKTLMQKSKKPLLLVGRDISTHPQKENILNMLSALRQHSHLEILCECDSLPQGFALEMPQNLPEHNGCVIFVDYFSGDSAQDSQDSKDSRDSQIPTLKISREFARAWHLSDKQEIRFALDSREIRAICDLSADFSGIIGILRGAKGLNPSYPFKTIAIQAIKGQ